MIEVEGYVIVFNPLAKHVNWDGAAGTFGLNPTEAWIKHIGPTQYYSLPLGERSMLIQRHHDGGFRLKKAKMYIDNSDEK